MTLCAARPIVLAMLIGAGLTASDARAGNRDGADEAARRTKSAPAFAASQAICRKLAGLTVPPGDAPTSAEAAALADCSSEALYYGIGRPADPRAARLCAFVENRSADPQVTDFGFTGDRILMTVYANGLGAPRNLDLAKALACRSGGSPAEIDGRVRHLAKLGAEGWAGTDFSLCDDAASGMLQGICADHDQLVARAARARDIAALSAAWSPAERTGFASLKKAEAAFVDARGEDEVDRSGSGRGAFVVEAEERAERAFVALLSDAEAGRIAPASAADARAADAALEGASAGLLARAPALAAISTVRATGLASAQRAWRRYRDAWMGFAKLRYPASSPDALWTRLTRERTAQLADVPAAQD